MSVVDIRPSISEASLKDRRALISRVANLSRLYVPIRLEIKWTSQLSTNFSENVAMSSMTRPSTTSWNASTLHVLLALEPKLEQELILRQPRPVLKPSLRPCEPSTLEAVLHTSVTESPDLRRLLFRVCGSLFMIGRTSGRLRGTRADAD